MIAPLRPPAHSIWATFLPPRSAAWANVSACSTPAVPNADVLLANGWPLTWNVLFVEPWTPGHAPVVSVNHPAPVFGGDCVSSPLSDALAPFFSRSRKPGTTPCFAYASTASWRMPSDAKNNNLSERSSPLCPAAAPVRRRGVDPERGAEADQQRGRGEHRRDSTPAMPRRTNGLTG